LSKRVSEEEITQLRKLTEQVEHESERGEVLPPSKRKVRNYLFITQCVMVVILCFAYFPLFLHGIGMSIITFNGDFIRYMFFAFVVAGPVFIVIWGIPLTVFFVCRRIRIRKYEEEMRSLFRIINQELHVRKHFEDEEISAEAKTLRNLVKGLRKEYDIEEFIR
jgi:hypothetical protein